MEKLRIIIAECRRLGDEVVTTTIVPEKLQQSGGYRYREARRHGCDVKKVATSVKVAGAPFTSSQ